MDLPSNEHAFLHSYQLIILSVVGPTAYIVVKVWVIVFNSFVNKCLLIFWMFFSMIE